MASLKTAFSTDLVEFSVSEEYYMKESFAKIKCVVKLRSSGLGLNMTSIDMLAT